MIAEADGAEDARPALPCDDRRCRRRTWFGLRRPWATSARAEPWRRRLARLQQRRMPASATPYSSAAAATASARNRSKRNGCGLAGLRQRALPGGRASLELLATRPPAVLLRSAYRRDRALARPDWLDHPLAKPKRSRIIDHRRPAMDLRRPADARRGRTAEASRCEAVGHRLAARLARPRICCCRLRPLREAQAIDPGLADLILVELRLPRTLLVLGYGAVLGVSGAALQAMFANPLASPDISGASSGAALGAVLGGYWLGLTQPLAARRLRRGRRAWDIGAARRRWPGAGPTRRRCCSPALPFRWRQAPRPAWRWPSPPPPSPSTTRSTG